MIPEILEQFQGEIGNTQITNRNFLISIETCYILENCDFHQKSFAVFSVTVVIFNIYLPFQQTILGPKIFMYKMTAECPDFTQISPKQSNFQFYIIRFKKNIFKIFKKIYYLGKLLFIKNSALGSVMNSQVSYIQRNIFNT